MTRRKENSPKAGRNALPLADPTTDYARKVVAGKIVAGPYVRGACQRHLDDLRDGAKRGLWFDLAAAADVIRFFCNVLTVEQETKDVYGETIDIVAPFEPTPHQCFILGSLFGWKRKNGNRRYRRAYIEEAKGNGKSPLAAGIGLYMLTKQSKLRAEVYSAATDKDQAGILFKDAVAMRDRKAALRRRLIASGENPVWQLTYKGKDGTDNSIFRPVSSEQKGKSGYKVFCALLDEIHEHPDDTVIEMMRAGTKRNTNALIVEITNSGFDKKSVCGREHDYSVEVITGVKQNDSWFAIIACLDEGDDPFEDPRCWIKANPNLGITIQPDFIREQVDEARGMPSKEALVRRLHFCEWTSAAASPYPLKVWKAALGAVDPDKLSRKFKCFGGLDLSRVRDLTAFTLVWMLESKRDAWRFASKTWFWTPKDTLRDRAKADRSPYELWAKQEFLEAVPGSRIKYDWLASSLSGLCARYEPELIGCDQYGLSQLVDHLDDLGVKLPLVVHPQGFNRVVIGKREDAPEGAEEIALWMPDSINKTEAAILEGRMIVDDNPVMTMCAMSTVYEPNKTGHRMYDKSKATNRIDGMVSQSMAIGTATLELPSYESIYETRGLLEIEM